MISTLESAFIRPPRQSYYDHDLGPAQFTVKSRLTGKSLLITRTETTIINTSNLGLSVSIFQPEGVSSDCCVIYLHTHHGSKLEGTSLMEPLLASHINVCLFDFAGYGNSEGDYVTLGIEESKDISVIIEYLNKNY